MTVIPATVQHKSRSSPPSLLSSDMPFARAAVLINGLVPLAMLIADGLRNRLGVNSVNYAIHTTGMTALVFLLLSLCVTPLRSITGFSWLIQFRRSLGLYGFFYACCHLTIFYWWDRAGSLSSTVSEIIHRNYLIVGSLSLLLMVPLAVTSTNYMLRKLGGKKWKALHRLAYLIAALGCVHYYMQVKRDVRQPVAFFIVLGILLGYRVVALIVHQASKPAVGAKPQAAGKARFWKGNLRIAGMFKETENVRTFRLVPEDGETIPFRFSAGQFLNLSLNIDGKKVGRSYTIASPPTRDGYVELTIKREDRGHVSKHLHDMAMQGQSVAVSGPAGRFIVPPDETRPLLLIAGGVGVTPVMAILRERTDRVWPGAIDFIFSVRSMNDVIFADELNQLARRHPNVHIHITLTRDIPADWTGARGRITAELVRSKISDLERRRIFICGPDAMASGVRDELLQAGVDSSNIMVESFTPAAAVAMDAGMSPAEEMASGSVANVTFERSNRSAPLPFQRSILEAAEAIGVEIDSDCRSGICGRCRTKLLNGDVTMAVNDALSDADIADGFILACQAHATRDVAVDA